MRKCTLFLKILLVPIVLAAVLLIVFFTGRYGWKMFGFHACESADIESVEVTADGVRITGCDPSLVPDGFLGYHAEETNGILYVGFRFSGLFGMFETGRFDITVPTDSGIREVYIKTSRDEYLIWSIDGISG